MTALVQCVGQSADTAVEEHDVCGAARRITVGRRHPDSHAGNSDRRSIVRAVTDHGAHSPVGLQRLHDLDLLLGCHARKDAAAADRIPSFGAREVLPVRTGDNILACDVEPQFGGDRGRCCRMIPGQHAHLPSVASKFSNKLRCFGSQRVRESEKADRFQPLGATLFEKLRVFACASRVVFRQLALGDGNHPQTASGHALNVRRRHSIRISSCFGHEFRRTFECDPPAEQSCRVRPPRPERNEVVRLDVTENRSIVQSLLGCIDDGGIRRMKHAIVATSQGTARRNFQNLAFVPAVDAFDRGHP